MLPLFAGLIAATLFGVTSTMVLGSEALYSHAWVDITFWSLIGTGVAISSIQIVWPCLQCKLTQLKTLKRWHHSLCRDTPCA